MVAIIAVLVAISIPIFTSQLEKAREATDAANIRSQYAEVMAEAITDGGHVKGNKMVDMQLTNKKLVDRGTRMIMEETGISDCCRWPK